MPKKKKMLFGEYLMSCQLVTQEQVDIAVVKQRTIMGHRKIGEILVRCNCLTRLEKDRALAKYLKVRIGEHLTPKHLREIQSPPIDPNFMIVGRLYKVVPISRRPDGSLRLATTNPAPGWVPNLELMLGAKIKLIWAPQIIFEELFQARFGEPLREEPRTSILDHPSSSTSFLSVPMCIL